MSEPRPAPAWSVVAVAIVFGLFYAYDLFEGISNLVGLPQFYEQLGVDGAAIPWPALVLGVVAPPAVFALAALLGRGRSLFRRALLFVVGLAVVNALGLTFLAVAAATLLG